MTDLETNRSGLIEKTGLKETSRTERVPVIFEILKQTYPLRPDKLNYTNPYTLLVATILSSKIGNKRTNMITEELFKKVDNPKKMISIGSTRLQSYIKNINSCRNKAKYILKLSRILVNKYNSQVPLDRDLLESFQGIGRKGANAIMNELCGTTYITVDIHVKRCAHRLELISKRATSTIAVEQDLYKNVPTELHAVVGDLLMLHGKFVCKALEPQCNTCPLRDYCPFVQYSLCA